MRTEIARKGKCQLKPTKVPSFFEDVPLQALKDCTVVLECRFGYLQDKKIENKKGEKRSRKFPPTTSTENFTPNLGVKYLTVHHNK